MATSSYTAVISEFPPRPRTLPEANPFADAQALRGLALLASGLPRVKAGPTNLEARLDGQLGSWLSMALVAAGVPMGASDGIGYVLGAAFDIPHGHICCIMLPAVMHWNRTANAACQATVTAAMGHAGEDGAGILDGFIAGLGMPRSLGAVKIGPESFERIAEQAMGTPWMQRNLRPIGGPGRSARSSNSPPDPAFQVTPVQPRFGRMRPVCRGWRAAPPHNGRSDP